MNKEKVIKHKKHKSYRLEFILWLLIFSFIAILVLLLFQLFNNSFILDVLKNKNYYLLVGVVFGVITIFYLLMYRIDAQNIALKENDLEDTEWLTSKKIHKLKEFKLLSFKDLKNKEDGIVISAEKKKRDIEVIETSQLHAMIVGTTGSGKTTGFVDQNIVILGKSKTKPSLIITDPKKELYEKHESLLKEEGYQIYVLDLREPYSSIRWNPMNVLIRRIRMVKEIENNLENKDGKYYANDEIFLSYKEARTRVQELKDEIYENAKDLVYTLCPIANKEQPTWEEGARNLILGLVIAFCEDCIKGIMDEKQLLLFNIYHNITKYCSEDTTALKEYLVDSRDEFSKVKGLVNTVLITSDKTLTSYLSEVNSYMQLLTDDGILSLTSDNELDIISLDEKPSAVFVVVPDERFTRHPFVTLFITQMYKELVEKANLNLRKNETSTAILKRNTYFILDEFGNLPKFENIEGMVTVARSRGIRYLFVLQSFSQLNARYGKDIADIIKTNCNVKIFIGSDDNETRKEFSELCGNKKIKNFSVNTSITTSASSNTGASNQPLITMGMLERLNGNEKGNAIVSVRGYEPIWAVFTPSYELKHFYFSEDKKNTSKREARLFEKENYVFDIINKDGVSTYDKIIDEINKLDEDNVINEEYDINKLKELDKKWDEIIDDVNKRIEFLSTMLEKKDREKLIETRFEDKIIILYELIDKYDLTIAQKIEDLAEYISKIAMPELMELQNLATK